MANETRRWHLPVPPWNADWQKWQALFGTFAENVDATAFALLEHQTLLPVQLPNVEIVNTGPGVYEFTPAADAIFLSRTLQVQITVDTTPVVLTPGGVVCLSLAPGATGPITTSWEVRNGGTEVDSDLIAVGYVTSGWGINWFNGADLPHSTVRKLFSFGAGGGSGLFTWPGYIYVDATNGSDLTGTGAIDDPYQTLVHAASTVLAPGNWATFNAPCCFVLGPGTYTGAWVVPRRRAVAVVLNGAVIIGDCSWVQSNGDWFGNSPATYPASLFINGAPGNYAEYRTGTLTVQNAAPDLGTVGSKFLVFDNVGLGYTPAGFHIYNQASGATVMPSVTGSLLLYYFHTRYTGSPTTNTVFGEGEHDGLGNSFVGGANSVVVNADASTLTAMFCGNIKFDAVDGGAIGAVDYTVDPAGNPYAGSVGGASATDGGLVGVDLQNFGVQSFGYNAADPAAYVALDLGMDATTAGSSAIVAFTGNAMRFMDTADFVGVDNSAWVGSLFGCPADDVQETFDWIDSFLTAGDGGVLWQDAIYVAPWGSDVTGTGEPSRPYQTLAHAATTVVTTNLVEWHTPVAFVLAAGTYADPWTVPDRCYVTVTGHRYEIDGDCTWTYTNHWAAAGIGNYRQMLKFDAVADPGIAGVVVTDDQWARVDGTITHLRNVAADTGGTPLSILGFRHVVCEANIYNLPSVGGAHTVAEKTGPLLIMLEDADTRNTRCWFGSWEDAPACTVENPIVIYGNNANFWSGLSIRGVAQIGEHSAASRYGMVNSVFSAALQYHLDQAGNPYTGKIGEGSVLGCRWRPSGASIIGWNGVNGSQPGTIHIDAYDEATWGVTAHNMAMPAAAAQGELPHPHYERNVELARIAGYPADAVVVVRHRLSDSAILGHLDGLEVRIAYTAAKLLLPGGQALSATNRAAVLLPPGTYEFPITDYLEINANYVDFVGMCPNGPVELGAANEPSARITGSVTLPTSTALVHQTVADVRMVSLTVSAGGVGTSGFSMDSAVSNAASEYENCVFESAAGAAGVGVTGTFPIDGKWSHCRSSGVLCGLVPFIGVAVDCAGGVYSWGGGMTTDGSCTGPLLERCVGGQYAFGASRDGNAACSSIVRDCTGGDYAFGGAKNNPIGAVTAAFTGTAERCVGGEYSFGGMNKIGTSALCNGILRDCTGTDSAFGGGRAATHMCAGILERCVGGNYTFGGALDGFGNCAATMRDCVGGLYAFGGVADDAGTGAQDAAFSGVAVRCTGGNASFGYSASAGGASSCTGELSGCTSLARANPIPVDTGALLHRDCYFTAVGGVSPLYVIDDTVVPRIYNCTLIAAPAGAPPVVGLGAQTVILVHCRLSADVDVTITNLVALGYNVIDADLT